MLFNILNNKTLRQTLAIPADEGLDDMALELGWRMLVPALPERLVSPNIMKREAWEWNLYLYDEANSGESTLLVDDARFSPYVEDVADEYEKESDCLPDDPEPADEVVEASYDMEETFHHLNQQHSSIEQ